MNPIGIIGLGKLGLPLALLFAEKFEVHAVDISKDRINQIINQERFFEPQLNEYLSRNINHMKLSTDYSILKECDPVFIIVQTPSLPNGKFDLKYVKSAVEKLHEINPHCLCVISSTINIGDIDKLRKTHPRIAYNPEFIRQGSIIHDFLNPKFVLIGAYEEKDGLKIANIWRTLHNKPIYIVKPVEAEIIKLGLNFSFVLSIAFANVIGEICEAYNADPNAVLEIMYKDRRNYKPGLGAAGPCFPRDLSCFNQTCNERGLRLGSLLAAVVGTINHLMVDKYVQKIMSYGKKKIGILGVAYKAGVPYIYESQAIEIAKKLLKKKCELYIYDELAEEEARKILTDRRVNFCNTITEVMKKSEIIFIGTPNYKNTRTDKPIVNPWT